MKSDLKRIEATLQHLELISTASSPKPAATRKVNALPRKRSYSFEICGAAQQRHDSVQQLSNSPEQTPSEVTLISATSNLQPDPAQQSSHKEPTLPKFNSGTSPADSSSNSAAKMLLPDYTDVAACQAELQQIVRQITDLYMEGPIVDGWLESHQCTAEPINVTRCDEVEQRVDYVKAYSFEQGISCESPHAAYHLCGFDAVGQKWSRPCPLAQLPSVSIAIARYQYLQQLLKRKHYFETCLSRVSRGAGEHE
jgi:hypothetical protein